MKRFKQIVLAGSLVACELLAHPVFAQDETPIEPTPTPIPALAMASVTSEAQALDPRLDEIDGLLESGGFDEFNRRITELETSVANRIHLTEPGRVPLLPQRQRRALIQEWQTYRDRSLDIEGGLQDSIANLGGIRDELRSAQELWSTTAEAARRDDAPPAVIARIESILNRLVGTRNRVKEVRAEGLTLLDDFVRRRTDLDAVLDRLVASEQDVWANALTIESPPLWKVFSAPDEPELSDTDVVVDDDPRFDMEELRAWADREGDRLILSAAIFATLLIVLLMARRILEGADVEAETRPRVAAAAERPISGAVLATMLLSMWLLPGLPPVLNEVLILLMLVSWALLIVKIVDPVRRRYMLVFAGLVVADRYLTLLFDSHTTARILLFLVSVAAAVTVGWILRTRPAELESPAHGWSHMARRSVPLLLISFALGAIANLIGAVVLADLLTRRVLVVVTLALLFYPATLVLDALVLVVLRRRGPRIFQAVLANTDTLERWVLRFVHIGAFLLWLDFSLSYFSLSEASGAWLRKAVSTRLGLGEGGFTVGSILTIIGVFAATLLASRIVRQLLQYDVFPRVTLPRGVPDAISTLVRYSMIAAALVMAPLAAGVDFSSLAFIAGGLGVGIGFGLQNVVANFVSGLILIFERPIQVGDSVKLGEFLGKVKTIGIRSSVVQTFDGGDVILPNSDLVSQPMLNWTRTDLRRRMRVEIIVEHGADPHRVLEILGQAAADHEAVFPEPEPHLLFDGFSETGLHFALQCWVPIASLITAPSELRLAIYDALIAEGVGMPAARRSVDLRQD